MAEKIEKTPDETTEYTPIETVFRLIDRLVEFAQKHLELDSHDVAFARNKILGMIDCGSYRAVPRIKAALPQSGGGIVEELFEACAALGLCSDDKEAFCDAAMDAVMLTPRQINERFGSLCDIDTKLATDWLYNYSTRSDYVKKEKLDNNPRFVNEWFNIVVTINRAKPEFADPKTASKGNAIQGGYPQCTICRENEGFYGRNKRTLRTVDLTLGGQPWFWQYSPYGYFNEHGIAVNCKHTPMHVDGGAFLRLMEFAHKFPHYFIGCNAALPRIGGSVLAHDHYQGGGDILPMHGAKAAARLSFENRDDITVEVLDWGATVIKLSCESPDLMQNACDTIRLAWEAYNDPERGIISVDADGVHNAVSPTVIFDGVRYNMFVILRSNITSEKYPDGVFHAHPEYHAIKKESIGLIEAQGLFILPARLDKQLGTVMWCLYNDLPLPDDMAQFQYFFDECQKRRQPGGFTKKYAKATVEFVLVETCSNILKNIAVFETADDTCEFLSNIGFSKI